MVPPSSPSKREGGKGLSRMHGNGHVRFLGGGAAAMSPCYPITADAVVETGCSPAPADPDQNPRRHAARPVYPMVSGHGCQRQPSRGSRHGGLSISLALTCSRGGTLTHRAAGTALSRHLRPSPCQHPDLPGVGCCGG